MAKWGHVMELRADRSFQYFKRRSRGQNLSTTSGQVELLRLKQPTLLLTIFGLEGQCGEVFDFRYKTGIWRKFLNKRFFHIFSDTTGWHFTLVDLF